MKGDFVRLVQQVRLTEMFETTAVERGTSNQIKLKSYFMHASWETFRRILYFFVRCCCYLFRLANSVKGQRHHMGTIENVSVPATAGDGGDLASVETDGHLVGDLRL